MNHSISLGFIYRREVLSSCIAWITVCHPVLCQTKWVWRSHYIRGLRISIYLFNMGCRNKQWELRIEDVATKEKMWYDDELNIMEQSAKCIQMKLASPWLYQVAYQFTSKKWLYQLILDLPTTKYATTNA